MRVGARPIVSESAEDRVVTMAEVEPILVETGVWGYYTEPEKGNYKKLKLIAQEVDQVQILCKVAFRAGVQVEQIGGI